MKFLKRIGNGIYYAVVVVVIFVAVTTFLTVSNTPFNYKLFLVQTGSMRPAIKTGSIVIVGSKPEYKIGDIITFYLKNAAGKTSVRSTATHRIVQINQTVDKTQYQTKGDANATPDVTPVEKGMVLGAVVLAVPLVGYVLMFSRTQLGFVLLVVIPATLLIYSELLKIKKELVVYLKKRKSGGSVSDATPSPPGAVLGILFFVFAGVFFARPVMAYSLDNSSLSSSNEMYTLLLDLAVDSDTDTFSAGFDAMARGDAVTRNMYVQNVGEMPFNYKQSYEFVSGSTILCNGLDLKVTFEGDEKYNGALKDYQLNFSGSDLPVLDPSSEKMFDFEVSVPDDAPYIISSKTCTFNIKTVAWQDGFADETSGFSDAEALESTIATADWTPETPTGLTILDNDGDDLLCAGVTNYRDITVDWDDNTEFDLNHYNVQDKDSVTIATPVPSQQGVTLPDLDGDYQYRVSAVDNGSNESPFTAWCSVTLDRTIQDADEGDVLINEIMWPGSTVSGDDEWLELYNSTGSEIKLKNWVIENAGDGSDLTIPAGYTIPANGYFLISRYGSDDSSSALADSVSVDWATSSIGLSDSGEKLTLKDAFGNTVDETDSGAWAAGENGVQKRSMERNDDPGTGWHSCTDAVCNDTTYWDAEGDDYGTPKAENQSENDPSTPENGAAGLEVGAQTPVEEPPTSPLPADEPPADSGGPAPSPVEVPPVVESSEEVNAQ